MSIRSTLAAAVLAAGTLGSAQATTVALVADGNWNIFDVSDVLSSNGGLGWIDINDGSAMSFAFTVAAGSTGTLTVVDGAFSGDVFGVRANGVPLANTSGAVNSYPNGSNVGLDFNLALANPDFSRGIYTFGAGNWVVTGLLATSGLDGDGAPLNSTVGALRLQVSAVPEPASALLLLAGAGAMALRLRRRAAQA